MDDDHRTIHDYNPEDAERLLDACAVVLRSFGSAFGGRHLAIVGGIVPGLLVPVPPAGISPHAGTGDLDLHLSLHLLDGGTAEYYDAILDGLRNLGFEPGHRNGAVVLWRHIGRVQGVRVELDFLCPTRTGGGLPEAAASGTVAETNVGPGGKIRALAVKYGHLVPLDTVVIPRRVNVETGSLEYDFPVAGLASWLCLKTDAIMLRPKPKDSYDVVWLVGALGPADAADEVARSPLMGCEHRDALVGQLRRLVNDQFRDPDAAGCGAYAEFLGDVEDGLRRRDAHGTMKEFARELATRGVLDID